MPLPTFDSPDAIPEAFRSEYTEKDGKYVPKAETEVASMRESQRKLLDERKRIEAEYNKVRGVLGDRKPEEIEAILSNHATAEEERQKKAGEFDKILQDRVAKAEKKIRDELEPKATEGAKALAELEGLRFDLAVRELATAAGIPEKNHKAVIKITQGDHLRRVDGKIVVVDANGDVRSIGPDKFFAEEFKTDYPELYVASGGSGGGSTSTGDRRNTGGGAVSITDQNSFLKNVDQIAKGEMPVRR